MRRHTVTLILFISIAGAFPAWAAGAALEAASTAPTIVRIGQTPRSAPAKAAVPADPSRHHEPRPHGYEPRPYGYGHGYFGLGFQGVTPGTTEKEIPKEVPIIAGAHRTMLSPGQDFDVCLSDITVCPAMAPACDDQNVAVPVNLPSGLVFRGVASGTTHCSIASSFKAQRMFYYITVR